MPKGEIDRARAGLLFIESYRELPLLMPRKLIDALVGGRIDGYGDMLTLVWSRESWVEELVLVEQVVQIIRYDLSISNFQRSLGIRTVLVKP